MIKSRGSNGKATVTFTLDPRVNATRASVCGDFNQWSETSHEMRRGEDGGFTLTLELEPGRSYRFRYLLDGDRWENDWAADAYVPNDFGADDSLVDLTALADQVPPAKKAAPKRAPAVAKKVAAKKAPAAKKAAGAKKAPRKSAG
jgi:1,4-alpha-glucan branching enzyme